MITDEELERQLRTVLHETLDREVGPDPAWPESPAARRVPLVDRRSRRRWPLRVLAVAALIAAGGGAVLLGGGDDPPNPSSVPANGWIAFGVTDDASGAARADEDIWLVALDHEPRRVIGTDTDTVDELCPAFSPDGLRLAYARVDDRNTALAIVDVNAGGRVSEPMVIEVRDGLSPPCPIWSPDGHHLAFGDNVTSPINPETTARGSEVWIVTATGTTVAILPDLLATDLEWSPDGDVLAIASGEDGRNPGNALFDGKIALYSVASGSLRFLDETLGAYNLTWSPDGTRIAYATDESRVELRVIDIGTEQQVVLASRYGVNHGIGPVWSPDGETIAYQRLISSGERHEVVLVSAADGSEVVIRASVASPAGTSLSLYPRRVTWSPDGKYLLYVAWGRANGQMVEPLMAAVPLDPDMPTILLPDVAGMVGEDGYSEDATVVPLQAWGREPAS